MEASTPYSDKREATLASTTDSDVLRSFREALIGVYPILQRLHCLEDDTQPYDDFDRVAEVLWEVIVLRTLSWREGLTSLPQLPKYGFSRVPVGSDGYIEVHAPGLPLFRFIQFIGDRSFGIDPFNAIQGVEPGGNEIKCSFGPEVKFSWVRKV